MRDRVIALAVALLFSGAVFAQGGVTVQSGGKRVQVGAGGVTVTNSAGETVVVGSEPGTGVDAVAVDDAHAAGAKARAEAARARAEAADAAAAAHEAAAQAHVDAARVRRGVAAGQGEVLVEGGTGGPAVEITDAVTGVVRDATGLASFCMTHPQDPKCVARSEYKKQKIRDAAELYSEGMKNPETRALIESEMAKSRRDELLHDVHKYCRDLESEACKIAKQEYADFKAAHPER